jgi:RNA polymerase sigma factor (sigma-70 family)
VDTDERLFRGESGRILAALTRIFGVRNLSVAEDVMQDTFLRAVEVWKLRGVPENPPAWLMKAAKNRAIDLLRRERTSKRIEAELEAVYASEWTLVPTVTAAFDSEIIKDEELRMIVTCCDPRLSTDAQVALTLHLLCGLSVSEIAGAFLSKRATIEKRIERGKKTIASFGSLFDLADGDLPARLSAVHRTLYLLFNEGYHGASPKSPVRSELCRDAIRLTMLLLGNPLTATTETCALGALMCLSAARLPARLTGDGSLVGLLDQDRSLWDTSLIARGHALLERASVGEHATAYHIEAGIAMVHASSGRSQETDWVKIVWLYDLLMKLRPTPVVALNRAIAIGHAHGAQRGIEELEGLAQGNELESYPFLPAALGEFERRAGRTSEARRYFEQAAALARNDAERRYLLERVVSS